jgi:hypothetical protein
LIRFLPQECSSSTAEFSAFCLSIVREFCFFTHCKRSILIILRDLGLDATLELELPETLLGSHESNYSRLMADGDASWQQFE